MRKFDFDAWFQRAVLRLMMVDDAFNLRALQYVDSSYFTAQPFGWMFTVFKAHQEAYNVRCTEGPLRNYLRHVDPKDVAAYTTEVDHCVSLGYVAEADYIKAQLAEWVKRNLFAQAHEESARLYNEKKYVEAYDAQMRANESIINVAFEKPDRAFFFDELSDRQARRHHRSLSLSLDTLTTGIKQLDQLTEGGAKPGELWAILGEAKKGKTTWLINMVRHAVRTMQAETLVTIHEGKREQWEDKLDACMMSELYTLVKSGRVNPEIYREAQQEYMRLKGLVVLRVMNDWDTTILDIEAEMAACAAMGFKPRVWICDYADLLRSRHKVQSETQHQIDSCRDMKRLIVKKDLIGWTGFQGQRPKEDDREYILTSGNLADAYGKSRIIDALCSTNMTREEMERKQSRFFMEMYRDAKVGRLYLLENEFERMRVARSYEEMELPKRKPKGGKKKDAEDSDDDAFKD